MKIVYRSEPLCKGQSGETLMRSACLVHGVTHLFHSAESLFRAVYNGFLALQN